MGTEKSREGSEAVQTGTQTSKRPNGSGVQDTIGRKLRDVYQEVVNEDVPQEFLKLLAELKKRERGGGSSP